MYSKSLKYKTQLFENVPNNLILQSVCLPIASSLLIQQPIKKAVFANATSERSLGIGHAFMCCLHVALESRRHGYYLPQMILSYLGGPFVILLFRVEDGQSHGSLECYEVSEKFR